MISFGLNVDCSGRFSRSVQEALTATRYSTQDLDRNAEALGSVAVNVRDMDAVSFPSPRLFSFVAAPLAIGHIRILAGPYVLQFLIGYFSPLSS